MPTLQSLLTSLFLLPFVGIISFAQVSQEWKQTNGPEGGDVRCFVKSGNSIFAGTWWGGVYYSNNSGDTWERVISLGGGGVRAMIAFDSVIIVDAMRSEDNGKTWLPVSLPYPDVIPIYFSGDAEGLSMGTLRDGILNSLDKGKTWVLTNRPNNEVVFDKRFLQNILGVNVNAAVRFRDTLYVGTERGVYRVYDSVHTFKFRPVGLQDKNINCLFVDGSSLFVGTERSGVYVKRGFNDNWVQKNKGLINYKLKDFTNQKNTLFVASDYWGGGVSDYWGGIYRSVDNGVSWTNVGFENEYIYSVTASENAVFVTTGKNIHRSLNQGTTWSIANPNRVTKCYSAIAYDQSVLVVTDKGILRSDDNGTTWVTSYIPKNENDQVKLLLIDSVLIVSAPYGEQLRSFDKGRTWSPLNYGSGVFRLKYIHNSSTGVFASDGNIIFQSNDYGISWDTLKGPFVSFTAIDKIGNTYYVSSWSGLFESKDKGATWKTSIPYYTHGLRIAENKVFICTYGAGIWMKQNSIVSARTFNTSIVNDVEIYPNPASDEISLAIGDADGRYNIEVRIFNMYGLEMKKYVFSPNYFENYRYTISLADFANGSYFLRITSGNNIFIRQCNVVR